MPEAAPHQFESHPAIALFAPRNCYDFRSYSRNIHAGQSPI